LSAHAPERQVSDVPSRPRSSVVFHHRPMTGPQPRRADRTAAFPDDVDVAIVAHNNLPALPATLRSLADARCPPERITLVDVASTDGSAEWLAREWPKARHRRLDRNDGPSPGRNVGITESTRRFVLLMDGDVRIHSDAVQRLHDAMTQDA